MATTTNGTPTKTVTYMKIAAFTNSISYMPPESPHVHIRPSPTIPGMYQVWIGRFSLMVPVELMAEVIFPSPRQD